MYSHFRDRTLDMPVPQSHQKLLNTRMASFRAGKSKPISHDELMRRLRFS